MVEPPSTSGNYDPGYRLDAKGRQEAEDDRLSLLEQLLDPLSRRRRELVQPGWRCLEIGAGRGSMAVWLAKQVGESGHVVATDIDLTYLKRLEVRNLEVRQHNILGRSGTWRQPMGHVVEGHAGGVAHMGASTGHPDQGA
jgi:hypothetical protein